MSIPVLPAKFEDRLATPAEEGKRKRHRRGVTAMEYLVCISFILVVVIFTVQSLGINTGKLFGKSSNATNAINNSNSSGSSSGGSGSSGSGSTGSGSGGSNNGSGSSGSGSNGNGNGNGNGSGNNGNGKGNGKGP